MAETKKTTTKKATTKKTTTKKATSKVATKKETTKKAPLKKETKTVAQKELKEETKKDLAPASNYDFVLESEKTTKKSNMDIKTIAIIVLSLLVILLGILCLTRKSIGGGNVKISEICPQYNKEESTITLPKGWIAADDGYFYENVGNKLVFKGFMQSAQMNESDYNEQIASMKEYYEIQEDTLKDMPIYRLDNPSGDQIYSYFFIYNEGNFVQIMVIDDNNGIVDKVKNGINF